MKTVIALIIMVLLCLIVATSWHSPTRTGYELKVGFKGGLIDDYYVSVLTTGHSEDFGTAGSGPDGIEGGKTVAWSPLVIGEGAIVRWGVEGQDGLAMTNRASFDTSEFKPMADQIRAVEFYFDGVEWEMKAYTASIGTPRASEIKLAHPVKGKAVTN